MGLSLELGHHVRSYPGAPRGGDAVVVLERDDGAMVTVIDATGHGLTAYAVVVEARRTLHRLSSDDPAEILNALDAALRGGPGAAISVVRVYEERVVFAGVGNVRGAVGDNALAPRPGVVGVRMRTPHLHTHSLPPDRWLLLHTDGVAAPREIPRGSAETVARAVVHAHGSDHDDAAVFAARWRGGVP